MTLRSVSQIYTKNFCQLRFSVAFCLIREANNPLYRFGKWNLTHKHTYGQDIASPRSGERFSMIHDDQVSRFLRLQAKRRVEDEYWAYDSSSISSYSETHAESGRGD